MTRCEFNYNGQIIIGDVMSLDDRQDAMSLISINDINENQIEEVYIPTEWLKLINEEIPIPELFDNVVDLGGEG